MSDRGPSDPGGESDPTEYFPPIRDGRPPNDLPPIGADRDPEPTRVVPAWDDADDRTTVMPPTGGGYAPVGGAGGGGPGDPFDPYVPYDDEPEPWYRQRGPLLAIAAGAVALILAIVALVVLTGGDDDDAETTLPSSTTSSVPTTTPPATTEAASTTTSTTTTTTLPPTTTSSTTTTTTSTTTSTTSTTTTTTLPPTTTTLPPAPPPSPPSAWDVIQRSPGLSDMEAAIVLAGLEDEFSAAGITVLAPTNDAFAQFRGSVGGGAVLEDPEQVEGLLLRHLVPEVISSDDIFTRESLPTAEGTDLTVDGENRTIQGATITTPDQASDDGSLLHAINLVLL